MLRPIVTALTALALLPAAAGAATVRADGASTRTCTLGAPGAVTARLAPDAAGVATVRVRAARGDWDLTVLDAATRKRMGGAASTAGDEWSYALVTAGRPVLAVACRRPGASRTAEVSLRTWAMPAATERTKASLVRVGVPDEIAHARLEATGLDVTHNHDHEQGTADVVLYGPGDQLKLLRAGFLVERILIADMRAHDLEVLRADERRAGGRSLLPSGRTTYRTLADYDADLKKIVAENPAIARSVTIGKTLEGRNIDAVELAEDVAADGDGRPTFLVLGVHHAREWPSGEMPMEFAIDVAERHAAGDPRVKALLQQVRILAVPVLNRDGFEVSRTAGGLGPVDDSPAPLPLSLTDSLAYKRKNCRAPSAELQATPCLTRPTLFGVDLNRNYGAFWGGTGSSTDQTTQQFRGPRPYSEPESEAVHRLSSTRTIPVIVSHHTFTAAGTWLRQPGFCKASSCTEDDDVVQDEAPMRELGDAMGEATGWQSQLGWAIGQITGATEDWNYFTQGTLGYTPEQRAANFHPSYAAAVVGAYDGTTPGAAGGVGEALLRAAETAASPASHAVLEIGAPKGRELRLTKAFQTATSQPGVLVDDQLDFRAKVPATGKLEWHVNQSSRPSCDGLPNCNVPAGTVESYELECMDGERVVERRTVTVARGQRLRLGVGC